MDVDAGSSRDQGGPADGDAFVALYRRFRPARFAELKGQSHVVRGLLGAVRADRVGHAYLFSGPRGTGKTSAARILAKALNCEDLQDGEPCGRCASCVEIARGSSLDVHELDAASNNGVDAMRDLVSHAALGTPGRSKVYIVDEVHMLSNAAANALLKTLEEPPAHVVFVLATTDPQKVPATIRSRTQHFEFRLLSADTLSELLSEVRDRAGLDLDAGAVSVAVRRGRGSARDALSALDQVAATGSAEAVRPEVASVLEGLCDDDAVTVLSAVAALHDAGYGSQQLAVDLVDELRTGFLAAVGSEAGGPGAAGGAEALDEGRGAALASRLGLPRLVRAIEALGRAQVDMRDAADPRVVLEAALVRLARPDLNHDTDALLDRIARLEHLVLGSSHPGGAQNPERPTPPPPERTTLSVLQSAAAPPAPGAAAPPVPGAAAPPAPGAAVPPAPAAAAPDQPSPGGRTPTIGALRRRTSAPGGDETARDRGRAPDPSAPDRAGGTQQPPAAQGDDNGGTDEGQPPRSDRDGGTEGSLPPPEAVADTPPPVNEPTGPDRDTLVLAWGDHVVKALPARAKALFGGGHFVSVEGDLATFALPSAPHRDRCEELREVVEDAVAAAVGTRVRLRLVVEDRSRAGSGPRSGAPGVPTAPAADDIGDYVDDEDFDPDDPGEPVAVESVAEARLLEVFPGAQEVRE
ncbi:MAG TPA: DNA polymerase III subunit gamma/tau [Acidimicrobiales bacterium]|jgi:DNA polymerase-3 subunit gamma/tau